MSIASEIQRLQSAKADLKTAIEAKGVTVPSSATIDTYDDYVAQITGGLTRYTSGTPYCDSTNLVVDVQTEISIDGGTSWVESGYQYTVIVESGASQCALPYDAEIEYLESTGTQYINTNTYITNVSNFEIGYTIVGNMSQWGYVHQGSGNGTWITAASDNAYYGNYTTTVNISSLLNQNENTIIFNSSSGVTVNNTFRSKIIVNGTDSIAQTPLMLFVWYDFKRKGVQFYANSKFKSFYLKNNGELVLDMIPVRVGQVGYMYDRVSRELFGNAGTGSFVLGADK